MVNKCVSYPNKWHKFLTGVLIRAVKKSENKKNLWVWPTVGLKHFQHSRGAHEHSMVLEGRWLWHGLHHVPSQRKWHMTGLGGMGSSRGVTIQWDEWEDLLLTTRRSRGGGVSLVNQDDNNKCLLLNTWLFWICPVTVWLLYVQDYTPIQTNKKTGWRLTSRKVWGTLRPTIRAQKVSTIVLQVSNGDTFKTNHWFFLSL